MTPNVPMSDTGTATLGISVARPLRRNRNTTRTTSATASASVFSASCSDARIVVVRSIVTARSIAPGIDARSVGRSRVTRSTVSMMLALGWRFRITQHRRLAVGRPRVAQVLHRVDDVGDVGEPDRRAVAVGHDERHVIGGFLGLIVGADLPVAPAVFDRALRAGWRWRRRARRARPRSRCRTWRATAD